MTTAELIVRTLDLVSGYPRLDEMEPNLSEAVVLADEIKQLYAQNKRTMDFTAAAFQARVTVVNAILARTYTQTSVRD